jgi:outer membrane protein assembly factor BamB
MAKQKPNESAQVVREYGPFVEGEVVHGVSYDGQRVWYATGKKLRALDPVRGELTGELDATCDAGTAYDGQFLYQLGAGRIQKIDPHTGRVLASLPSPGEGDNAGLTWAEGKLWVSKHRGRKIHQIDPESGEVLRALESNRFVTGVTWVDGELWHGTLEDGVSELRRIEPDNGEVIASLAMPAGAVVTGLESDRADLFYCGGGSSGKLRAVKRPRAR